MTKKTLTTITIIMTSLLVVSMIVEVYCVFSLKNAKTTTSRTVVKETVQEEETEERETKEEKKISSDNKELVNLINATINERLEKVEELKNFLKEMETEVKIKEDTKEIIVDISSSNEEEFDKQIEETTLQMTLLPSSMYIKNAMKEEGYDEEKVDEFNITIEFMKEGEMIVDIQEG